MKEQEMGLSLHETMSGWVDWNDGEGRHPFSFSVSMWSDKLQWWRARKLSGLVNCPGRFLSVPAFGVTRISPPKGVEYDFCFNDPKHGRLRLYGKKQYSLRNFRSSLITLPAILENSAGNKVADLELVYRAPLLQLVKDMRLYSKESVVSSFENLKGPVLALAETLYPVLLNDPLKREAVWNRFNQMINLVPRGQHKTVHDFYQLFSILGTLKIFTPFEKLSVEVRIKALDLLQKQGGGLRKLVELVQLPLRLAIFDDRGFYQKHELEIKDTLSATEPQEKWQKHIFVPSEEWSREPLECDVVVVGSGAGGAVVADSLTQKGLGVIILEEGRYWDRKGLQGRPIDKCVKLYRSFATQFALGVPPIALPTGIGVGGTTLINSGTCFRTPSWILEQWRKENGLHELQKGTLDPYFEKVENRLKVKPGDPKYLGPIADVIAEGAQKLGYAHAPLRRNADGCDGQASCAMGCPTAAKTSTNISFIPSALQNGANLFTGYRVYEIIKENGKAVGVRARVPGFDSRWDLEIRAKSVVLSTGTLMTPRLLMDNDISASHPELGRNLSIHPALNVGGMYPKRMQVANYIPQSYSIEHFCEEGLMFEGGTTPPEFSAASLPIMGTDFQNYMDRYQYYGNFGIMVRDTNYGHLKLAKNKKASIFYQINEEGLQRLTRGIRILGEVLFEGGAEELLLPISGRERVRNKEELMKLFENPVKRYEPMLTAYHPLGTCRLGASKEKSVISPEHEVWDLKNLFVVDGSAVPGPLGVNPQITIMSLAMRAAEFIAARI
ncbi:GMC family oxidoreductase [Deltaproteobacteria bacterium TL4]